MLRCLSNVSWGADTTQMMRLYHSLIRSKIDYACHIYASTSQNVLKILEPVHNSAIRICTGAFKSSPIPSLLATVNEPPPLSTRRDQLGLQYYHRLQQLPDSPHSKQLWTSHCWIIMNNTLTHRDPSLYALGQ